MVRKSRLTKFPGKWQSDEKPVSLIHGWDSRQRDKKRHCHSARWFRTAKNRHISTALLARPFAYSLAPLTHLLAPHCLLHFRSPLHSFLRILAHSHSNSREMFQHYWAVRRHSALVSGEVVRYASPWEIALFDVWDSQWRGSIAGSIVAPITNVHSRYQAVFTISVTAAITNPVATTVTAVAAACSHYQR